jgi:ribonucleoside-diphosphate reductase alpha chain
LNFDDRLELGLASIDDMPELQTSLIDSTPEPVQPKVAETKVASAPVATESLSKNKQVKENTTLDKEPEQDFNKITIKQVKDSTAPLCYNCGNQTQRAGSCYVCSSCGSTTGCS